jgi:amidase
VPLKSAKSPARFKRKSSLSPANAEGIVGIKPTVGLVSRSGIIPITADQGTAGPLTRTVRDAAIVLGVIAGYDPNDPATKACLTNGNAYSDYTQFLDKDALKGARIAVPQSTSLIVSNAILILQYEGAYVQVIPPLANVTAPGVLPYGFKRDLNAYLAQLPAAWPRRTLADIIAFNNVTPGALKYGQTLALASQALDISPGSADTATYQTNVLAGWDSRAASWTGFTTDPTAFAAPATILTRCSIPAPARRRARAIPASPSRAASCRRPPTS